MKTPRQIGLHNAFDQVGEARHILQAHEAAQFADKSGQGAAVGRGGVLEAFCHRRGTDIWAPPPSAPLPSDRWAGC